MYTALQLHLTCTAVVRCGAASSVYAMKQARRTMMIVNTAVRENGYQLPADTKRRGAQ